MPLQSRATQSRVARADPAVEPPKADAIKTEVQPRRGKPAVAAASEGDNAPVTDAGTAAAGRSDAPPETEQPRPRKPRATTTATVSAPSADTKAIKARMKAIESEFKLLAGREKLALRDLASGFRSERTALENEHRLLSNQLSAAVFNS